VILGTRAPRWRSDRGFAARLVSTQGSLVSVGGWPAERDPGDAGSPAS